MTEGTCRSMQTNPEDVLDQNLNGRQDSNENWKEKKNRKKYLLKWIEAKCIAPGMAIAEGEEDCRLRGWRWISWSWMIIHRVREGSVAGKGKK